MFFYKDNGFKHTFNSGSLKLRGLQKFIHPSDAIINNYIWIEIIKTLKVALIWGGLGRNLQLKSKITEWFTRQTQIFKSSELDSSNSGGLILSYITAFAMQIKKIHQKTCKWNDIRQGNASLEVTTKYCSIIFSPGTNSESNICVHIYIRESISGTKISCDFHKVLSNEKCGCRRKAKKF